MVMTHITPQIQVDHTCIRLVTQELSSLTILIHGSTLVRGASEISVYVHTKSTVGAIRLRLSCEEDGKGVLTGKSYDLTRPRIPFGSVTVKTTDGLTTEELILAICDWELDQYWYKHVGSPKRAVGLMYYWYRVLRAWDSADFFKPSLEDLNILGCLNADRKEFSGHRGTFKAPCTDMSFVASNSLKQLKLVEASQV